MILNREFYSKISYIKSFWNQRMMKKLTGEKVFKAFKLHKTEWPNKLYFYSPRLKRIPKFTGNTEALSLWKESKLCEMICPTQAIKVTADAFIIDDRGCIACGLCVEMAPPGVLEMSTEPPKIHRS
jgi:Fe-S-cluster-containing hydrogenase component 2